MTAATGRAAEGRDVNAPAVPATLDTLQRLEATVAAQQDVITALVEASERRAESVARLGTQHEVEQRTARLHHAERVLRSVIEALDGALCIVGADGTVLDANRRWLQQLPSTGTPTAGSTAPAPGSVGSDFFTWCSTAEGMQELLAEAAGLVREVLAIGNQTIGDRALGDLPDGAEPVESAERSVKGQVGAGDGRRWVVVRIHPVRDHHAARAVVSMIDITDGMSTQEQLRVATAEAQRLALVARATANAVVIPAPDGTIEWVNVPFIRRTGYALAEAVGRRRRDLMAGPCLESAEFAAFFDRLDQGMGADGEFPLVSRGGEHYWADVEVRSVLDGDQVAHLVWVEQDVTVRRQTQERLQEAMNHAEQLAGALSWEKTLLAGVIGAVPQLVFWKDSHGRYVGCNEAYLAFRGIHSQAELLGRNDSDVGLDDAMAAALRELEATVMVTGHPIVNRTMDLPDSQDQRRSLLLSVLPLEQDIDGARGVIGVGADITHAHELERQLAQANRLESIGQLAAGIAHEINTPIQYISDNSRFISDVVGTLLKAAQQLADLAGDDDHLGEESLRARMRAVLGPVELDFLSTEAPGALAESQEGLARVTEIVRAMKDYAHPGHGRAEIDVNRAIESTVQVCRNEWKYVAQVRLELDPDAGLAPCFEGELKQVALNMIVNAAQAIGEQRDRGERSDLGSITISTSRTQAEFVITIADDGPGMTEKVRDRVFDPFFTTKEVGKGTGQGLSLAHAVIVTKHQGRILLDTAPGQGATFTVRLPLNVPDTSPTTPP
ncbi:MAG TPA: ATP-binding protein [Kineosporiaceae bacterium]|nr:ATP-binding protein [Kineosporiaceae bacterium]